MVTLLPVMKHKHLVACERLNIFFKLMKAWYDFWKYEVFFSHAIIFFRSLCVYGTAASWRRCLVSGDRLETGVLAVFLSMLWGQLCFLFSFNKYLKPGNLLVAFTATWSPSHAPPVSEMQQELPASNICFPVIFVLEVNSFLQLMWYLSSFHSSFFQK